MLERIESIQGIGLLHEANGKQHLCRKATLIYADNGRGKSTLATVLRSVATGDATLITHRKTIDGTLPPKVVLQFASGHKVIFSGNAWSETRPEILVFDAEFVERNVHSGGAVSTGHRKNLLEFALGEAAVAARTSVDLATDAAKAATEKVQSLIGQLSGHHAGLTLTQFEALPNVADADAQVVTLQKRMTAANSAATILAKPVPEMISEPAFDIEALFASLNTSLQHVHVDAERVVRAHVLNLGGGAAEGWLSQGQHFSNGESCPYCGQDTVDVDLILSYQTHFNAAYAALKSKVAGLRNIASSGTRSTLVEAFSQSVSTAQAQASAWSELAPTQLISFDEETAKATLTDLQNFVLGFVGRKEAAPTESIGSPADLEKAVSLWHKVIATMKTSNAAIKAAEEVIATYKGKLSSDNVQLIATQIAHLEAGKRRHDLAVADLFSKLKTARTDSATADAKKKSERDKLDALMKTTLSQYEKSINALLNNFGAKFSIKGMGANFRGSAPRSEYGLMLRGKDVALEGGPPSFSTTLSEGDKRTLAFAFFIASTLEDKNLSSRVVIIDDPMCSLDLNRKHHTRSVLKELHSKVEQLVVLAHDPYFLRDLRDALHKDAKGTPIAQLQLTDAAGEYTDFAALDIDKEYESTYFQHHRLLKEFVAGENLETRAVANAIRPMLEGYLRRRFPSMISKELMFGQIVVLIRNADATSPLNHAQNLVSELNKINDYAGQFHHDNADTATIVAAELKTYVVRALHLVHGGIPMS